MTQIHIDDDGHYRCWSCAATDFTTHRTKARLRLRNLLLRRQLRCRTCGEINHTDAPRLYPGPAADQWQRRTQTHTDPTTPHH
ncbi:hypothetical protein GS4_02_02550 [Gordonia soli NBRC 108243]|uniref:Uncharacterized protein n=1 Tax=Gordonia soli NBRC 108243 TaxID=1223545 RepID=M0QD52_9ACTN|nr:hypothetical protein GS4_02_02550 [Gordonia soli NBRC 108243]